MVVHAYGDEEGLESTYLPYGVESDDILDGLLELDLGDGIGNGAQHYVIELPFPCSSGLHEDVLQFLIVLQGQHKSIPQAGGLLFELSFVEVIRQGGRRRLLKPTITESL
jgi:hypothetical protein